MQNSETQNMRLLAKRANDLVQKSPECSEAMKLRFSQTYADFFTEQGVNKMLKLFEAKAKEKSNDADISSAIEKLKAKLETYKEIGDENAKFQVYIGLVNEYRRTLPKEEGDELFKRQYGLITLQKFIIDETQELQKLEDEKLLNFLKVDYAAGYFQGANDSLIENRGTPFMRDDNFDAIKSYNYIKEKISDYEKMFGKEAGVYETQEIKDLISRLKNKLKSIEELLPNKFTDNSWLSVSAWKSWASGGSNKSEIVSNRDIKDDLEIMTKSLIKAYKEFAGHVREKTTVLESVESKLKKIQTEESNGKLIPEVNKLEIYKNALIDINILSKENTLLGKQDSKVAELKTDLLDEFKASVHKCLEEKQFDAVESALKDLREKGVDHARNSLVNQLIQAREHGNAASIVRK
jgi:hypothetical protein